MTPYAVQWYALRVRGKGTLAQEHASEALQARYGEDAWRYDVWAPMRSYAARTRSKGWFCKCTPVLPGYLFVRIPADPELWADMSASRAVLGFLSVEAEDVISGDKYQRPACIPTREVEYLMACERVGDYDGFGKWLENKKRKDRERKERQKWKRGLEALAALAKEEAA